MVGFSWNVGHALTFKVLTDDTCKVISCSQLHLADEEENKLEQAQCMSPAEERTFIHSKRDFNDPNVQLPTIPAFDCPFVDNEDTSRGADDMSRAAADSNRGEDTSSTTIEQGERAEGAVQTTRPSNG